jgi:hypothetical protein
MGRYSLGEQESVWGIFIGLVFFRIGMDADEFIEQYLENTVHDSLEDVLYDEFARHCRSNGITDNDISNEELMEAARDVSENGF